MRLQRPGFLIPVALAFAIAQNAGGPYPSTIFYLTTATVVLAGIWTWMGIRCIRVETCIDSDSVTVGEDIALRVKLRNAGPLPLAPVLIQPAQPSAGPQAPALRLSLAPFGTQAVAQPVALHRRGRWQPGRLVVSISDPFGLFAAWRRVDHDQTVIVYPRPINVPLPGPSGVRPQRVYSRPTSIGLYHRNQGDPSAITGARPMAPGDSPRQIHWKASARRDRLYVKEYHDQKKRSLTILLDMCSTSYAGAVEDADETATGAALGLAATALKQGLTVSLLASSSQPRLAASGEGPRHYRRLQDILVDTVADGDLTFPRWLQTIKPQGSWDTGRWDMVVLITPVLDAELVATLSRRQRESRAVWSLLHILPGEESSTHLIQRLLSLGVSYLPLTRSAMGNVWLGTHRKRRPLRRALLE